jgi:hypothetical protein
MTHSKQKQGVQNNNLAGRKAGKVRSPKNALRHGLAIPILAIPELAAHAEALALRIAGSEPSSEVVACARRIAEAQIDLLRLRETRFYYVADSASGLEKMKAKTKRGDRLGPEIARIIRRADVAESILPFLEQSTIQLSKLDRYEARAISRRNQAIRMLDAVRAFENSNCRIGPRDA